jgi:8-amino-7-oxononanoate synthase
MNQAYNWIDSALETIRRAHRYRSLQEISSKAGNIVRVGDRHLLMFASNNYLDLAGDVRLIKSAVAATEKYGTGSTGSRLVSGHLDLHADLERKIADFKQTEAALVFSSGYLANLGVVGAIAGNRDLILADAYNHACLKQGAKLSGARVMEFAHNDLEDLLLKLEQYRPNHRRCLIATESVFSMDGDRCPLGEIMQLANQFNCMVLLDEAHSTGILGDRGSGLVEALGIKQPLIQVGTLSKALGSQGGYVSGSASLIDFLRNRSSAWIYTTALAPGSVAAAISAIEIVQVEADKRESLWKNVEYLGSLLRGSGISVIDGESPIFAVLVGNTERTLSVAKYLKEKGIFAPAIRPPTVPTSRIRITLNSSHTFEQIQMLVSCLGEAIADLDR